MLAKLTEWRMRRFLRTLPPVIADEALIRKAFIRDLGRPFSPWKSRDRHTVRCGAYRAIGAALDKIFPE